jgi:hypothetical protein
MKHPVNADSSVRKSKRTNAGKHSNPFNLPKSVAVNKADVRGNLDQVKYEQLGEAIAALGTGSFGTKSRFPVSQISLLVTLLMGTLSSAN